MASTISHMDEFELNCNHSNLLLKYLIIFEKKITQLTKWSLMRPSNTQSNPLVASWEWENVRNSPFLHLETFNWERRQKPH